MVRACKSWNQERSLFSWTMSKVNSNSLCADRLAPRSWAYCCVWLRVWLLVQLFSLWSIWEKAQWCFISWADHRRWISEEAAACEGGIWIGQKWQWPICNALLHFRIWHNGSEEVPHSYFKINSIPFFLVSCSLFLFFFPVYTSFFLKSTHSFFLWLMFTHTWATGLTLIYITALWIMSLLKSHIKIDKKVDSHQRKDRKCKHIYSLM